MAKKVGKRTTVKILNLTVKKRKRSRRARA